MMLMAMRHRTTGRQAIAQRGAVEMRLHIVRRQGIATEEDVNKARVNHPGHRVAAARMNDGRSSRQQHLAIFPPAFLAIAERLHPARNIRDDMAMRPFRRDLSFHEAEDVSLSRPLQGKHPDALASSDDQVSLFYLSHRHRPSRGEPAIHTN